jgi:hypothetical protein
MSKDDMPVLLQDGKQTLRIHFFKGWLPICFHASFDLFLLFTYLGASKFAFIWFMWIAGKSIMTKRFKVVDCRQSQNVTLFFYLARLCNIKGNKT